MVDRHFLQYEEGQLLVYSAICLKYIVCDKPHSIINLFYINQEVDIDFVPFKQPSNLSKYFNLVQVQLRAVKDSSAHRMMFVCVTK